MGIDPWAECRALRERVRELEGHLDCVRQERDFWAEKTEEGAAERDDAKQEAAAYRASLLDVERVLWSEVPSMRPLEKLLARVRAALGKELGA